MRIAILANTAWNLHNFRYGLIVALQNAGHEVIAIAPQADQSMQLKALGCQLQHVPLSGDGTNPLRELRSVVAIYRALQRNKVELVFSYTPKGNIYAAMASICARIPYVPNVSGLGRSFIRKSFLTLLVSFLYRMTFSSAHKVLFQNHDDMALFIKNGFSRSSQSERIPGSGVNLHRFAYTPPEPSDVAGQVTFLLIARLMWDKGVAEFVEATRILRREYPQARCQLLGFLDVNNPSAVRPADVDAWTREGIVEYLPATEDVRPFIAKADCVVLPSYREGLPKTLIEAAAMGRPVIATDVPGCRDTVIPGKTGFLCRVRDAQDLAESMEAFMRMAQPERVRLGQAGRRYMEQVFSEHIVLEKYLGIASALSRIAHPE